MLLVKVRPDRLAEHWAFIKLAIVAAAPPSILLDEAKMLRILKQLLAGGMQVWVANRENVFPSQAIALLTTVIQTDELTGSKNLLLFSFYGWEDINDQEYLLGFTTLQKFAVSEGCETMSFYSNIDRLLQLASKIGFLTDFKFGIIRLV